MIDISSEPLIRLEDVRDYIPSSRKGKRLSKAVPYRWAKDGVRGVVLETVKVGGGRFTSLAALHRFIATTNADHVRLPKTDTARNERIERALKDHKL